MDTRILLIDDDARILQTFARTLKLAGYTVFTAENGEKGLTLYHEEAPDIVLLDLRMPRMSGLEALQAMREHDPEANVILATGHGDKDAVIEALRAGASDFLSKPIDQVTLESALRRAEERIDLKRKLRTSQETLQQQNVQLEATVQARTEELTNAIALLQKSETRFRTLFETMTEGVALHQVIYNEAGAAVDYVLLDANPAYQHHTGISVEEARSKKASELYGIEEPPYLEFYTQVAETGAPATFEVYFSPMQRHFSISVFSPAEGQFATVFEDITNRKQTEKALRESETRLRAIGDNLPAGQIYQIRLEPDGTTHFTYVSKAVERLHECTVEEVLSDASVLFSRVVEEDVPAWMEATEKAVQEMSLYDHTLRIRRKSGEIRWHRMISRPRKAPDGAILFDGIDMDVTVQKQAVMALQRREEQLREAQRIAKMGSYEIDLVNNYWEGSEEFLRIFGLTEQRRYTQEEFQALVHPDDFDEVIAVSRQCLETGEPFNYAYRCIHRQTGEMIHVSNQSRIIYDDAGQPVRIIGVMQDITTRKRMEEALRRSEERFRMTIHRSPIGVGMVDHTGQLTDCNAALAEMVGYTREELIRLHFEDFTHPDDLEREWQLINELWDGETAEYRMEKRYIHKDGRTIWVDVAASLFKDEAGELAFGFAFVQDITERKQTEEALRRRNEYLRALQETTMELISQLDLDILLENIAKRAGELVGTSAGFLDLVDLATNRLVPRVGVGALAESLQYTVQPGEGLAGIVWQTGEPLVIDDYDSWTNRIGGFSQNTLSSIIGVPLLSSKNVLGVLGLAYPAKSQQTFDTEAIDHLMQFARLATIAIENSRLLEQTKEDAETKTLLLQEVNHRVLNNLTAIVGILDMEQRRPLDGVADLRAVLDDVSHRIGGMTAVHRMLSSAQWQPLDVKDVVAQVIHAALSGSPIRRQIEVAVNAPGNALRVPSKQAISLALVINELTTNSVKYAFQGRSQGRIDVDITSLDEETVQIIFRDDGSGMPDAVMAGEQQNVGLWLVETNIQHTLGGEITYRNDGGAVVTFTLDRVPLD